MDDMAEMKDKAIRVFMKKNSCREHIRTLTKAK